MRVATPAAAASTGVALASAGPEALDGASVSDMGTEPGSFIAAAPGETDTGPAAPTAPTLTAGRTEPVKVGAAGEASLTALLPPASSGSRADELCATCVPASEECTGPEAADGASATPKVPPAAGTEAAARAGSTSR